MIFVLVAICLPAAGAGNVWQYLPDNLWTQFPAQNASGAADYWIYVAVFSSATVPILSRNDASGEVEDVFWRILRLVEEDVPGRTHLYVVVSNWSDIQYFYPTNFVFVQSGTQYQLGQQDILPFYSCFEGGRLMPHVTCMGLVLLPRGIDITKPVTVWYNYGHAELGPIARSD